MLLTRHIMKKFYLKYLTSCLSFDDFIISYFVTGKGIKNLSIMVYTMSKRVNPSINAISTLIVIFITIVLILVNVVPVIREKRKVQTTELKENNWCYCGFCFCHNNDLYGVSGERHLFERTDGKFKRGILGRYSAGIGKYAWFYLF